MNKSLYSDSFIEDLGDGLILRRSTASDKNAIADFNGKLHAEPGKDFSDSLAFWVKDLMSGKHPTFNPKDFTIVEDAKSGKIVSSLNLIDQSWAYEGIEFGVGRVELVGTDPKYRRRGLVRKQMDIVHQWSKERGQKLQVITGIPWYYRQFGYEMTVGLGGGRRGFVEDIPKLKKGEKESFKIQKAQEKDIPFIKKLYIKSAKRQTLSCIRDLKAWKYEISGRNPKSATAFFTKVIENDKGKLVGYFLHGETIFNPNQCIIDFEIIEGLSWLNVTYSVLRYMIKLEENITKKKTNEKKSIKLSSFVFQICDDNTAKHDLYIKVPQIKPS